MSVVVGAGSRRGRCGPAWTSAPANAYRGTQMVLMILSANDCRFGSHNGNRTAMSQTTPHSACSHEVDDFADDGHTETYWLSGLLADDLELHDALADAGTGGALAIAQIPDDVGKCDQAGKSDGQLTDRGRAGRAELTEVVFRCVGDARRLAGADQQQPPNTLNDRDRDVVDQIRQHARKPWRISLFRQSPAYRWWRRVAEAPLLRRRREATLRSGRRWISTGRRRRRVVTRGRWRLIGHGRLPVFISWDQACLMYLRIGSPQRLRQGSPPVFASRFRP